MNTQGDYNYFSLFTTLNCVATGLHKPAAVQGPQYFGHKHKHAVTLFRYYHDHGILCHTYVSTFDLAKILRYKMSEGTRERSSERIHVENLV